MNATANAKPSARLLTSIRNQYKRNEAANHHAENVLLLTGHFGSDYQKKVAALYADYLDVFKFAPADQYLREKHNLAHSNCYAQLVEACKEAGIEI